MAHTHRHRHSHRDEAGHCGNHRSAPNSESGTASKTRPLAKRPERHVRQRPALQEAASPGKSAAALCVMFAFLGLGIVAVAEIVSRANHELINPVFNVLAGAGTVAAIATGVYSQTTQLRHWSRRVKRRLLVGLPVAVLNALMVTDNFFDKYEPLAVPPSDAAAGAPAALPPVEDRALVKAGWYGELQQDRLLLVVSSFGDQAAEARQFCRRLSRPASYATLSLINLGTPEPVVLQSAEVTLRMDTGEELQSWAVKPLLGPQAGANADLLQLLAVPRSLAAGAMLPDLPVCQETNFPWARVTAVTVALSTRTLTIPGRLLTAPEKQAMLDKAAGARPPGGTNLTSEAWFNNL